MNMGRDSGEVSNPFITGDRDSERSTPVIRFVWHALALAVAMFMSLLIVSGSSRWFLAPLSALAACSLIVLSQVAVWLAWAELAPSLAPTKAPKATEMPCSKPASPLYDRELDG